MIMKNYLSFGGGVNSVAMMLLLLDEGVEFEAVYVWMPDWPETHEYLMMLEDKGYPITVITGGKTTKGEKLGNLYEYAWSQMMMPQRKPRWCTGDFKIKILNSYFKKPCFVLLGIDANEPHRARIASDQGIENRYPLIERDIDRNGCIKIIKEHGLPLPIKSGCFICPFQRVAQLKQLRRLHPDYWCRLVHLENRNNDDRVNKLKEPYYTWGKPVSEMVNEPDTYLFNDMAYPPCQCGL